MRSSILLISAVGLLSLSCDVAKDTLLEIHDQHSSLWKEGQSKTVETPLWHPISIALGGGSSISYDNPDPQGGVGSIYFKYNDNSGYELTGYEVFAPDVMFTSTGVYVENEGFGYLSDLDHLSFHWYRSAINETGSYFVPAFRIFVYDGSSVYALVWEAAYNGYIAGVPEDEWVYSDLTYEYFWRTPVLVNGDYLTPYDCRDTIYDCYHYTRTWKEWGFGANARVIGLNIQVGSGWQTEFEGNADLVLMKINGKEYMWDFEPR